MSDESQALLQLDRAVVSVQFFLGAVMCAMGYWIKRQDSRLEKLEKDVNAKVSLEIYNGSLESLRREIREQGYQTQERIDKLLTLLAEKK